MVVRMITVQAVTTIVMTNVTAFRQNTVAAVRVRKVLRDLKVLRDRRDLKGPKGLSVHKGLKDRQQRFVSVP